ncbi:MAG: type II toxin-antitoxin system VapC family toxin [Desulfococcaceae bacterium]
MKKILLDTDIFSEILKKKNPNVILKAENYRNLFGFFTLSTITVLEIVKGFHKVNREEKLLKFLSTVTTAEILTLNVKSAEIAGRIYADLERTGQPVGRADPMIAAIALEHGLILSTGNTEHYQRIKDLGYNLETENWKSF